MGEQHWKVYLEDAAKVFLIGFTFFVLLLCVLFGIQSGMIPTSQAVVNPHEVQHSEFTTRVAESGETVFTATENVSEALRDELMATTYPSPEAAEQAAAPTLYTGNPALAHAVLYCVHDDGNVSHQTGGGRHLTSFRFHDNGRHYTVTKHQVLTQFGYQSTDTFYHSVDRNYCGC